MSKRTKIMNRINEALTPLVPSHLKTLETGNINTDRVSDTKCPLAQVKLENATLTKTSSESVNFGSFECTMQVSILIHLKKTRSINIVSQLETIEDKIIKALISNQNFKNELSDNGFNIQSSTISNDVNADNKIGTNYSVLECELTYHKNYTGE